MMSKAFSSLRRIEAADLALCLRFNRVSRRPHWRGFFRVVSRLGDGVAWYALMLFLPLAYGPEALPTVLRMAAAGVAGLLLYKWLKRRTSRPRPCDVYVAIQAAAPALDRFSFPSGHTLHAFSFAMVAAAGFPVLAVPILGFACLVAVSRPVLGLHYPSDVVAGAVLGMVLASLVLRI